MSAMGEIMQVARRDFLMRARSRAFLIMTGLTVGLILVMAPLLGEALATSQAETVGVVGELSPELAAGIANEAAAIDLVIEMERFNALAAAETELEDGDIAVVVVGGEELVWHQAPDPRLQSVLVSARHTVARSEAAADLGLTAEQAEQVIAPPTWDIRVLEPPDPDRLARVVVAQGGGFLLYMGIIIFGQFILLGVMEEKQNRVVEVILSRIPPTRLLAGKILGIGSLGLVQIVLLGAAMLFASTRLDLPDIDLSGVGIGMLGQVVFWYVAGFGLYAVLYGALGATVSRQEDAQGAVMIPTLILVAAYFIAIFSIEDPDGLAPVIGSLVPFTAPVVMPFRMASAAVPWWQVASSVGLVILTTLGLMRLGARVYSGAVLSLGKKVRLRDAWTASRTGVA